MLGSFLAGLAGAYVISQDPFRALTTEGTPGFGAAVASKAAEQRDVTRTWIAAYRHRTAATGLAFGAAIAIFVVGWLCLGLLAYFIREDSTIARIDSSVARWAHFHSSAFSESALGVVTMLGSNLVIASLVLVLAVGELVRSRNPRVPVFLVAVVVGVGVITVAIKALIGRSRPPYEPVADTLGPSFPSGHTSLAAAFFAAAALLLSRGRSRRITALFGGVAVGLAVAVAASRVFLDVHWISDVIAGLGLGWAWFAFCAIAFGGIPRRRFRRAQPRGAWQAHDHAGTDVQAGSKAGRRAHQP